MMKFEKPYEIIEGWEDFVQSEYEKEVIAANLTFAKPQSTALKVDETIKEKEKTSQQSFGFYISAKGNLHSIDSETESEEEIYAVGGLQHKPKP